jgi:hypothetical protein
MAQTHLTQAIVFFLERPAYGDFADGLKIGQTLQNLVNQQIRPV